MISHDLRKKQLVELIHALRDLVLILEKDPVCQWTEHFKNSLRSSEQFLKRGFKQADLADLSASIISVYKGMGSFNDYCPRNYDSKKGTSPPLKVLKISKTLQRKSTIIL